MLVVGELMLCKLKLAACQRRSPFISRINRIQTMSNSVRGGEQSGKGVLDCVLQHGVIHMA